MPLPAFPASSTPVETTPGTTATGSPETSNGTFDGLVDALPRIGVGIAIFVVAVIAAKILRNHLRPRLAENRTESFGQVMSRLIAWGVIAAGSAIGLTTIFPSIKPVDLIGGLGIFSIAIGFAFQDILSNLLAGILLLVRQPFESGDQIEVNGQRGTVQAITIRETQIKTFDGEKVIIPNAEVYQSVITVQTAYGPKRTTLVIGLDDWEDLDRTADIVLDAVRDVAGVHTDPEPQAYFFEFGASTTNMQVRYWTDPEQAEIRRVQDRVVRGIGKALKEAEISMPSPITEIDVRPSVESLAESISGTS
jgi:small-conductance mechanosensitive channel